MSFYFPWAFLLVIFILFLFSKKRKNNIALSYSNTKPLSLMGSTFRLKYHTPVLKMLRALSLLLIITALARPRTALENIWQESEAVDIMLIVDVSSSMLAEDFSINNTRYSRLEVVKRVIKDFIGEREQDRIGIIAFAGEPMIVCPLTTDYSVLNEFLEYVKVGILPDNTAIGDAVGFGVNRIKKSAAKSKIMILLTDGGNNAGMIDPLLAADLAASQNIKVYTIGAGKNGPVPYPIDNPYFGKSYQYVEFPVDEELLKKIADKTGGKFYRATSTEDLKDIYSEINKLEKTKIKTSKTLEYKEIFPFFLIPGILILLLEVLLSNTVFLRAP